MSVQAVIKRKTAPDIRARKNGEPIVMGILNIGRDSVADSRMFASVDAQVQRGRIRDLPIPLLIQQLMGPMVMHMLFRPALDTLAVVELPDLDTTCTELAANFVRAVAAD